MKYLLIILIFSACARPTQALKSPSSDSPLIGRWKTHFDLENPPYSLMVTYKTNESGTASIEYDTPDSFHQDCQVNFVFMSTDKEINAIPENQNCIDFVNPMSYSIGTDSAGRWLKIEQQTYRNY